MVLSCDVIGALIVFRLQSRAQRGEKEKRPPYGLVKNLCLPKSDMTEDLPRQSPPKHCLVPASWLNLCMYGFLPHGCPPLMPSVPKMCGGIRIGSQQGTIAFADS